MYSNRVLHRKPCNSLATYTFRRHRSLPKTITKSVRSTNESPVDDELYYVLLYGSRRIYSDDDDDAVTIINNTRDEK